MEIYVHFLPHLSSTIGVWWKIGNVCSFLAKLASYDRCVVTANGQIMTRNELTIGVWWKIMSISCQIGHLR